MRGCGEMGKAVRVCVRLRASAGSYASQAKECVFGKGTCSLSDAEGKAKVFAFVSMGADTRANACGAACALERRERRRRGQQLAQHDRSRLTNALAPQVELRDAVLAQGEERDPAEVGHTGVLEHRRGQILCGIARDVAEANAVTRGHRAMV